MKYLLSNKFKRPGWILFTLGVIAGIYLQAQGFESDKMRINVISLFHYDSFEKDKNGIVKIIENDVLDELIVVFIVIGGLLISFSKEKIEDEFIAKTRLDSLAWAIIVNYILLLLLTIFIYDMKFFHVLIYSMFTPLFIFIIRFHYVIYKNSRS
ncbi:hypothetical protein [Aquimarina litoralis]|uniref:hypothetical protein n=1 Tax=Aquimarina litoralis TaxID=584605 RepID=UPI001C59E081|nr:hypothetical protein [Aquimarina litoralis]MBW1296116.1 hypothetical protein [Aquimarina litoralis]